MTRSGGFSVFFFADDGGGPALWKTDRTPEGTFAVLPGTGELVGLHFHASWCPTCRAQEKVFNSFKGDASVPGTVLVVDYDQERELKRELNVRSQSTLIIYKGKEQKHRSGGVTEASDLRAAWVSAR